MFERLKELIYAAELNDDDRQAVMRREAHVQSEIRRVMNGLNPEVTPEDEHIPQLIEHANSFLQSRGFAALPEDFEYTHQVIVNNHGDSFRVIVPWTQLDNNHFLEQSFCSHINELGVCVVRADRQVYHPKHNPCSFVVSDGHDW